MTSELGVPVFPEKRTPVQESVVQPRQEPEAQSRPTPLVRSPIQVPRPEEAAAPQPEVQPQPAEVQPDEMLNAVEPVDVESVEPQEAAPEAAEERFDESEEPVDVPPAADVPEEPEQFEDDNVFDDSYVTAGGDDDLDENIGNHPLQPFVRFGTSVMEKLSGLRRHRGGRRNRPHAMPFGDSEQWADFQDESPENFADAPDAEPSEAVSNLETHPEAAESDVEPVDVSAAEEMPVDGAAEPVDVPEVEDAPYEESAEPVDAPQPDAAFDETAPEDADPGLAVNGTAGMSGDDAFSGEDDAFAEHHFDDAPLEGAEPAPKKKFSLKGLFGHKKPSSDEDLLADMDFGDEDGLPDEEFGEWSDDVSQPQPQEGAPDAQDAAQGDERAEESALDVPPEAPEAWEQPEADGIQPTAEAPEMDGEPAEPPEEIETPPAKKRGFLGWVHGLGGGKKVGGKKAEESDDDLLSMLGDDDDEFVDWAGNEDEDEDVDDLLDGARRPHAPEADEGAVFDDDEFEEEEMERRGDMDEKDLIASKLTEGIGDRPLSRKERREMAERQAALLAAQNQPEPQGQVVVESTPSQPYSDVDEPTKEFIPMRTGARETVSKPAAAPVAEPPAEDDYDLFEVQQAEREQQDRGREEGRGGKRAESKRRRGSRRAAEDDDFDLFDEDDDEDEDEEPRRRRGKKPAKRPRYDDYDDDDDEEDDEDYDDDDGEGGGFFLGLIKVILTIVLLLAAVVIVLNVLSSRGFAPATSAVNAISDLLPANIGERLFPGATVEGDENDVTPLPSDDEMQEEEGLEDDEFGAEEDPFAGVDDFPEDEFDGATQDPGDDFGALDGDGFQLDPDAVG